MEPTDLRPLVFGLAAARWREDEAGFAALRFGEDPVDDRELLEAALDLIGDLAAIEASESLPAVGADEVIQRWALEMADG